MKIESSPITPRGNFILLAAGTLKLLLPLEEVGAVEYLDGELCQSEIPGVLKMRGSSSDYRFIALSEHMEMLTESPERRFIAASIGHEDELLWCWDEFQVLLGADIKPEPLPSVLLVSNAPFDHYVKLNSGLAYICDARKLHSIVFGGQEYKYDNGNRTDN